MKHCSPVRSEKLRLVVFAILTTFLVQLGLMAINAKAAPIRTNALKHQIKWISKTRVNGTTRFVSGMENVRMQVTADKGRYVGAHFKKVEVYFVDAQSRRSMLWLSRDVSTKSNRHYLTMRVGYQRCNRAGKVGVRFTFKNTSGKTIVATHIPDYTIVFDCDKPIVESMRFAKSKTLSQPQFYHFSRTPPGTPCMDQMRGIKVRVRERFFMHKVALRLTHSGGNVRVYPTEVKNLRPDRRSGVWHFYEIFFKVHTNQAKRGVNVVATIEDAAGHKNVISKKININGTGSKLFEIKMAPGPTRFSMSQRIVKGGSVQYLGCQSRTGGISVGRNQFYVQLRKLANRSTPSTQGRRVFSKSFRLQSKRSPFIITYQPREPGFYRLQFIIAGKTVDGQLIEVR